MVAEKLKERPQGRLDGGGWIILNWILDKRDGEGCGMDSFGSV
jgi:hypothetical protein